MSYIFERSPRSLASRTLTGVSNAQRVDDKKDDPAASRELGVVIFTEPQDEGHANSANRLIDKCVEGDISVRHLQLPHSHLMSTIKDMREAGEIGDGTQVIIHMHGEWKKLSDGADGVGEEHALDSAISTTDFVQAIRRPLEAGGKPCGANIYIASCYAGDNRLRQKLLGMQIDYGVGACFLLAGKKMSVNSSTDAALSVMCDQLASAKRDGKQAPPATHHILARMAEGRSDCMTLIEPKAFVVVHAPKGEEDYGVAGLQRAVAEPLVIIPEKGSFFLERAYRAESQEEDESQEQQVKAPHVMVAGDEVSLAAFREEVSRLHPEEDTAPADQWEQHVRQRVLYCDKQELNELLEDYAQFMCSLDEEWNHGELLNLLNLVLYDENEERRDSKAEYLFDLINPSKPKFDCLSEEDRVYYAEMFVRPGHLETCPDLDKLFVMDLGAEGSTRVSIQRALLLACAKYGTVDQIESMKDCFDILHDEEEWNEGHELLADMLHRALSDPDADRGQVKSEYICTLINTFPGRPFLQKRKDAIDNAAKWTLEEMQAALENIPLHLNDDPQEAFKDYYGYAPSDDYKFMQNLLNSVTQDPEASRRQEKVQYLLALMEPQFGMWAADAEADAFKDALLAIPGFKAEFEKDTWNRSHLFVLELMQFVFQDSHLQRCDDKLDFLFSLLDQKKAAFHASPDRDVLMKVAAEDKGVFDYLDERGFF